MSTDALDTHLAPVVKEGGPDVSGPASTTPSLSEKEATTETAKDETTINTKEGAVDSTSSGQDDNDEEPEYPSSWKLVMVTLALCLSVFCMALDNTIIATAIPRITDQFHSINDVGWYGSAYLLTTCAFQLFFGKLYAFYSIKWVYLTALMIFEVGSAVCGAAPNSNALIIGRAVAGLGSAGIFSGAILIVAHTVPLEQRPIYTGIIGSMYGIASVAGPLLGGVFTDDVTWRWCFYINLPLGAITLIFMIFFFTSPDSKNKNKGLVRTVSGNHMVRMTFREQMGQMDLLGTAIFVPAIVCVLLALQWGGSTYPWGNWRIILCFVLFGVLIACFVAVQIWKQETATVPPRILMQRSVAASCWFAVNLGAAFFVLVYFLPIWFQAIKGTTAVKSGIDNLPMILSLVIISIVAGGLVTTLGYYTPFCIASTVFMALGSGLLTTFEVDTNHSHWIGYQVIFGMGVGMGMQQTLIAVQTVLPIKDVPIGTALVMFSQTFGGSLFISVAQNIFTNELIKNLREVAPNVSPALVLSTGATTLRNHISTNNLAGVLTAYNKTLVTAWYVSVATAAASIIGSAALEWRSVKGKPVEAVGGA